MKFITHAYAVDWKDVGPWRVVDTEDGGVSMPPESYPVLMADTVEGEVYIYDVPEGLRWSMETAEKLAKVFSLKGEICGKFWSYYRTMYGSPAFTDSMLYDEEERARWGS